MRLMNPQGEEIPSGTTFRELLAGAGRFLEAYGVPDASYDAWSLFSYVSGMDRSQYFMHQMDSLADCTWPEDFEALLRKRASRIPLQQILGSAPFMDYTFFVNENVLCPRQDTETLVETAFHEMEKQVEKPDSSLKQTADAAMANGTKKSVPDASGKKNRPLKILDMCTGSGCIAISLYCMAVDRQIPVKITGVDLSDKALEVANINNERLTGGSVELIQSDMFENLGEQHFDMIVSNPPYIPSEVCRTLMPEVKEHEPLMALDGREDGLYFYRILVEEGVSRLSPGGYMFFEIGYDQGDAVASLLKAKGFEQIKVIKDLAGLDRVVQGRMPDGY